MHDCSNGLGKIWTSYTFHILTRILTLTHTKGFHIFSHNRCRDVQKFKYQNEFAKHTSTKVSFKITIRRTHVYIDIRWPWKRNQYFYLWIWNVERTRLIFLPSFQLVTPLNSQNRNETSLLMKTYTLICTWILVYPIGIIQVSTPRKWILFTLFQFLIQILTSNHLSITNT